MKYKNEEINKEFNFDEIDNINLTFLSKIIILFKVIQGKEEYFIEIFNDRITNHNKYLIKLLAERNYLIERFTYYGSTIPDIHGVLCTRK